MPHGHCYLWKPGLVWLHVVSDALIGLAYVAISLTLAYLVLRARGDIPFHWVLLAFGAFIIACGATHWMEVWTLWSARYWLSGSVKVVTAVVSLLTASALPPLVPSALALVEAARLSEARNAERERAVAAEHRQALRIRSLYEAAADSTPSHDAQIEAALRLGCQWFGLECGNVSRLSRDVLGVDYAITNARIMPPGHRLEVSSGHPAIARALEVPLSFHCAADMPVADRAMLCIDGVEACLGTPLFVYGERFGALAFASAAPRPGPFDAGDHDILQLLARWMGTVLERKLAAEDLARARDVAVESARLKSEFVSTMSHELRTPLNVIIGYADVLADGALGSLPEAQAEVLGRMRRSSVELLDLVNATLDLGRLEANREAVNLAPVNLDDLFAELERQLEVLVPRGVVLRWRNTLGGREVVTDRHKLRTILGNLVGNALKFTDHGEVEVSAQPTGGTVVMAVRDTGIGIAPDQLPVIFDMFRQADGSSTRRYSGVGLGLHIARRLAGLLGATIDVQSAPGAGSTFRIVLPASSGPSPARGARGRAYRAGGRGTARLLPRGEGGRSPPYTQMTATPIIASRVTTAASRSSLHPSVPAGRTGSTM